MRGAGIISRAEALQILRKDLRKAALEKRAAELRAADAETRQSILAQIDREIENELQKRAKKSGHQDVLY